jgi:hypothetical protein
MFFRRSGEMKLMCQCDNITMRSKRSVEVFLIMNYLASPGGKVESLL